jgi:hypothetical protein
VTNSKTADPTQPRHLLTFFDDKFARVKYEDELSLEELADEIRAMRDDSKAKLPWLKMARFGEQRSKNNCLRTNKNLIEISGIEIDYDAGEMPVDTAIGLLLSANVRCLVYTSASHTPERPRWRVLAPTSQLHSPEARVALVAALNGVLGGVIAGESFVLSTAYYYGYVGLGEHHRAIALNGRYIDRCEDLWAKRIYKQPKVNDAKTHADLRPPAPGAAPGYDEADIRKMLEQCRTPLPDGSGQWHHIMASVTSSLINKGWTDAQIFELTAPYCDRGWGDDDVRQLIRGARDKWQIPDPDSKPDMSERIGPAMAQAQADSAKAEASPFDVDEPDWRERYASGKPKPSLHNARAAIEHAGLHCSEDTFHARFWVGRSDAAAPSEPMASFIGEMNDASIRGLRFYLSDTYGLDFTEVNVREAALALAHENRFDPVVEMLDGAQDNWDGVRRLDRMAADLLGCEDTPLNSRCIRKLMIAAVRRARQPGCKFDTIVVLESPEGWNKSTAWAVLAGEGNFSDEAVIGKAGREVQEQLHGVWIHENAELAGMRKADIDVVKAFASRTTDRARPAYGRFVVEQPRHSVEVGTTNADTYLQSQTGNRRFWPMRVIRRIDIGKLRAVRLQLWGEAAAAEAEGESLVLDEDLWDAAAVEQEARRVRHPWEDKLAELRSALTDVPGVGTIGNGIVQRTSTEERIVSSVIYEHVLRLPVADWKRHAKDVGEAMRAIGWRPEQFRHEGRNVKGYVRPLVT